MVQAQLNITIRQDRQPTCFGYTNAQVSAIVTGGTTPYAFAWSSGTNNPNSSILSGIGAGNYTVTVTDNGGLSAVQSFSVTQPTVLSAAPASVSGNVCAATNENYAANVTGGVAPYTYRWYNVANTTVGTAATHLFTNAGQYYVSITDAIGCSTIKPLIVNAPLVATFDKNDVSCGGMCDGSAMAVVTGGKAPYSYHWDFMPMSPPNNRTHLTSVMFPVPGGNYTCTITDGAGCTRIISGSIYEPTPVGLNLTITAGNICQGNASIQAVGTGGFAGTKTYILTGQNNTPLGTNTTGTFTNLGIGEYHLVVKDPNDCPKDTLFSIRDMSTFNVSAIKTDASCAGVSNGSATAQISGGNGPWRYIWSNGATSAHVVNLASGNYTVSVYDGLNCFKTASVTIGTTSNLTLTTTGVNAACTSNNGSASVTVQNGTAPYTYAWSSGATTVNATQLVSGSYVVTVTDANGCRMVSNPVVITATNALAATGTSNPAICTATNGSIQITPTSGTAPYNYVLNGSNNATGQFTNLSAGSYNVAISDANGCNTTTSVAVATDNRTVTINPTVTNTSCRSNDGRIDLTATGSTNTFQYTLSSTPAVTNTTGQFVGLAAGSYNVTVVDGNGCRATTAAAVSNGSAALTCGATTVAATCTSATGGFTVVSGGGRTPYTYTMNGTVYTSPIFTGLTAGDYSVTMTDANGCQLVSVITVPLNTVAINLNVNATATGCTGSTGRVTASANGGTAPYRYTLNGVTNTSGIFANLSAGSFNVNVTDANGCQNTVATEVTTNGATITATAIASSTFCGSSNGSLTFTATGGTAPYNYTLNGVTNQNGTFTNLSANSYTVSITDATGCQSTRSAIVSNHNATITATATANAANCNGTGSISVTATGGTAPYTYTLNGVSNTTGQFTGLAASATPYNVSVQDANRCNGTATALVNSISANITITATSNVANCGGANGSIQATATGGTAPYTYTLNGVSNATGQFTGLAAATTAYTVSVRDANGCQSTASATVNTRASNVSATATTTAALCNGATGGIQVTSTGGTAPYTYTLNGVSNTTGQFTGLAASATPYTVTIRDANGCNSTTSATVNATTATITATATMTAASCTGATGGIQIVSTGGTAPYTYTLNGVSNTTGQFTGLAASATPYTVTIRDANGCNSTTSATVNATTATITATATMTAASCTGAAGGIRVVSTGGTAPYTYTLNGVSNTTGQFTGLAASATPYNVTIRDANGCTGATSATVSGSAVNLTATATSTPAICTNNTGSLTITASGGNLPYTYATNGTSNMDGQFDRLAAGTYAITITDANGCQSVQNQSVTATNPTITPTVNAANTTCTGNDGRITISATGGTNSYRFELPSSNNTNGQFTGLAVGNYVVTVVDGNGCRATANATVGNGSNVVTATSTTTPAICTNNNGVIVVTGAGGTAPYTYTLNGASNGTGRFENLAGNSYSIEIVDAGNCRTTTNVTLSVNNMNVSATVTAGSATCRGNDGGLTIVATGGNGNFWYAVNGVSNTTGVFTGLTPGSYTVISTDGNGCQARSTGLIQDGSRLLNPTVQATTPAVCAGNNGTANLNVTGGTGNYSYVLNGVTNSTGLFTGLATGTYTATITDGTTCRTTVPVTIGATTSNVVLTSNRVGATSCTGNDGSIEVLASGGTSPYTYRLNTASNTTGQFSGLSANTYTITATDANGCTSTVSATVNAATGLLATTADLQVPTCRNANGSFRVIPSNGTAPYTYNLGSQTNQTGIFTNLRTGDYVVTVTDANNCVTALPSVNLQSIGNITAAVTTTPVRCTGDSVTIRFTDASTVSGGGTQFDRNWLFGNGYGGTANNLELIFSTRMTNVRLIVTSTQGCADTISQNLPVGLLEIAVQDTATTCQNTTVNVATTNNSLGAPVSYTWTPSHLIASGGNTATPSLNVGTTRQVVYVSMTNGICTKTDSVVINPIIPLPVDQALVTNHSDCTNGLRVDFSNTNLNAGAYRWVFGDPANPTAGASSGNASYTYGSAGTYTALLVPAAACLDTIRRTFTIQSGSAVQLRTIPNYQTGVNFCDANITVQVRARTNATTVRWSTNRNFTDTIGTDTLTNLVPANGISTFYVEGKDARGCRTVDSTKLTDRSVGVDVQNNVGICADGIGHLVAENRNSRDTLTIMWTPPAGVTVVKGQGELKPDLGGSGTGYVYGFFRNQWGCTKLDSAKVDMINMSASLTARDTVVAKGDTTLLTVTPGASSYTYNWNPTVTTNGAAISVKPDTTTTYYVIVTDTNGCKAMAKVLVKVYSPECKDPFIYIPNAFSPNGDGNNEMLYVRGENLKQQCYFAVYNRWGEIVFESYDKEIGWDGFHKQTPVCPDVYGYYLRGTCKNGEPIFIKGNITVLK
jgi:large repetitive protein